MVPSLAPLNRPENSVVAELPAHRFCYRAPQGFLLNYTSNNFEYTANYTMVRGRHTFKMGETYRSWQQNLTTSGQGSGTFNYTGTYTNNPANLANTGGGLADFL